MMKQTSIEPMQFKKVSRDETNKDVLHQLEKLTEKHREIPYLRYYSDLSYAEIAETLDIQIVRDSRLYRAKSRLMEVIIHSSVVI